MTIIRIHEVSKRSGLSKAMVYILSSRGEFPSPIRLTKRTIGWREEQVEEWLNARAAEGYQPITPPPEIVAKSIKSRAANRAARKAAQTQQEAA